MPEKTLPAGQQRSFKSDVYEAQFHSQGIYTHTK